MGPVVSWAMARLQLFKMKPALGGLANDADSLEVQFRYHSINELKEFFSFLDVRLQEFTEKPAQPVLGKKYSADEMRGFVSLIAGTEYLAQPGHCLIGGVSVFIWVSLEKITISVNASLNSGYTYDEADFTKAEQLEKLLLKLPFEVA